MKKNESLTNANLMFSDEEAEQSGTIRLISWGDAVTKYGLNPHEQDSFLCFLRAHCQDHSQMDPENLDLLHSSWRDFEEEKNEGHRVSRKPGQLPLDALAEGYFMNPLEQDQFTLFIEAEGLKKTTRLPVLEAAYFRFRKIGSERES